MPKSWRQPRAAQGLAEKPLAAFKPSKQLLRRQIRPREAQAVQDEMVEFREKVLTADAREALTAFFDKRHPRFNTGESV
jgi:hypothetical protein